MDLWKVKGITPEDMKEYVGVPRMWGNRIYNVRIPITDPGKLAAIMQGWQDHLAGEGKGEVDKWTYRGREVRNHTKMI